MLTSSLSSQDVASGRIPRTDIPDDYKTMRLMAKGLAKAESGIREELRGKWPEILVMMLRAKAMDVPLMVAMDYLFFAEDGSVGAVARLLRGLARRAGHRIAFPRHDRHHVVGLIQLAGEKRPRRVQFTITDAANAGLTDPMRDKKRMWEKYPEDMLIARVTSRLVWRFCPEVAMGLGEEPPMGVDAGGFDSDVVTAFEESDAQHVAEIIEAAERICAMEVEASARMDALRHLRADNADYLDFAVDEEGERSVHQALWEMGAELEKLMREEEADALLARKKVKKNQGRGAVGGKGGVAPGELLGCGRTMEQAFIDGHTCGDGCVPPKKNKKKKGKRGRGAAK